MDLRQFQHEIDAWIGQYEAGYWPPLANLARLAEEVGELAREINHAYGPKTKKESEPEGQIADELGDILFTLGALANSMGIDLSEAAASTLEKVIKRDDRRWTRRSDDESR